MVAELVQLLPHFEDLVAAPQKAHSYVSIQDAANSAFDRPVRGAFPAGRRMGRPQHGVEDTDERTVEVAEAYARGR
jgi:hypothetical protein